MVVPSKELIMRARVVFLESAMGTNVTICLDRMDHSWMQEGGNWEFIRQGIEQIQAYFDEINLVRQ